MAFRINIENKTVANNNYRKVLHTTSNMQLVVMSVLPNEEIGMEKHTRSSQFIRVEEGSATAIIKGKRYYLKKGDSVIVPPNTYHNIINNGDEDLKLYTIYTPPTHPKNRIDKFKPEND
jgi:mannose-6-phosphate isomerase-like protein (cupin superfamily)